MIWPDEPLPAPVRLHFRVNGIPTTQGSKRGFVNPKTSRVVIVDDNKPELKRWRQGWQEGQDGEKNNETRHHVVRRLPERALRRQAATSSRFPSNRRPDSPPSLVSGRKRKPGRRDGFAAHSVCGKTVEFTVDNNTGRALCRAGTGVATEGALFLCCYNHLKYQGFLIFPAVGLIFFGPPGSPR